MKRARRSSTTRPALVLPAELSIYAVADLRTHWLSWLDAPGAFEPICLVNGAAVEQVDAAGMQLLISLSKSLEQRQSRLQLLHASQPLADACRSLGLTSLLATPEGALEGASA